MSTLIMTMVQLSITQSLDFIVANRVVIPGIRRPFGRRAGGPIHYTLYEPGGVL
jgi:hypothetical protein